MTLYPQFWYSDDGLLFHLASAVDLDQHPPYFVSRCGQQLIANYSKADNIYDSQKCFQCHLAALPVLPSSPLGRGDGSPLAGTAGDEIGQRLPQEVTEVASTQTALAGETCGHGARRDSATGESGIVFPHETPAGTISGDPRNNQDSCGSDGRPRCKEGCVGWNGSTAPVNQRWDTSLIPQRGLASPSEYQASPAGIPIHDEALALALDEGQNAANAWRRERHMQYSGEAIEELIGITIRAERGELR